ncbi:cytochrome c biogenesis protein CcsA [Marinobacterium sp. AK62]|uniref:Cytochrome c biogenesis protein CcsA n=1 Tax=Marinobacterium alkalitolerans TaxID=1542925 RepID=A0ABS3Z933_9GAMM|nr:cytochrome c biogenesis protein CcsA [Marinobacterium alkalitolerans]MBP0048222.1 cytochrome c biogenesis protein CcsA [Marinobacterium alkalitolerans]
MLIITTVVATLCYLIAAFMQWRRLSTREHDESRGRSLRLIGAGAFVLHGYAVYQVLHQPDGIDLGFFPVGSLIAWVVTGLVLLSSLRQKLDNLFIGVFPLAAITALLALGGFEDAQAKPYAGGLIAHILLSLLAYSLFTIATLQAVLLWRQEAALKHHHTRGLVASLPPLQIMERLLFDSLWAGFILLTASLLSGVIFVENLFAQHLAHKTALSLIAWVVYAILLGGRYFLGWRGRTAVRWTLVGFVLLMLGFFGSKLVLELIL